MSIINMNTKDYFKDIYDDFFGIESLKSVEFMQDSTLDEPGEKMASWFSTIDKLYLTEPSKDLLKKIIEYMRKYHEKIENNYIPFSIVLDANNDEIKKEIQKILFDASSYFSYIQNKKQTFLSFDEKMNLSDSSFVIIDHISRIHLEDEKKQKQFFYGLEDLLKKDEKMITLVCGTKEEITSFFLGRENIKNTYFTFEFQSTSPDVGDIYQSILEEIELNEDKKIELLDYISKTYQEGDYVHYKNDLVKYLSFYKEIPALEEKKDLNTIFAEVDELVGLEKVKKVLHELVDVIHLKEKAQDEIKINNLNLHMVFLGNPGTGKTTIARAIAGILYHLNYINENKLVEVSSKDLVAEYVGQTAPKTMAVIQKALGGVLFVDEAYSLASNKGQGSSYNEEAIATLIQAMENYRDNLVVIFAGYTKEMQDFLNMNSGIVSRIGYTVEFEDYTEDELLQIFMQMMTKSGFEVSKEAQNKVKEIITEYKDTKNFGNARFVRNVYEKSIVKHASNTAGKKQKKILKTIKEEDISTDNLIKM